ncbi:MAG: hypothetical protein C9356_14060 [Oleiphilus sp.]|nr:MAG: hypothetical protein C9356_14060 [Oleiphilus sp.]
MESDLIEAYPWFMLWLVSERRGFTGMLAGILLWRRQGAAVLAHADKQAGIRVTKTNNKKLEIIRAGKLNTG